MITNNNNSNSTGVTTPPTNGNNKLFQEGAGVWVPDQELGWIGGEVIEHLENSPDNVSIRTEDDREIKVPLSKVFYKNPDILEGVDDLSFLSHLHEPAILHNLHHRYNLNQIYTYIGKILIAINPYTSLPLYGKEMISAYYGKQLGTLSPHVYAVAEDAFKDMRYDGTSQSILVSGESGAGKTETTKFLLQYFAAMGNMIKESTLLANGASSSNHDNNSDSSLITPPSPMKKSNDKSIEERVLESTPLLEAFGNAKTLRNDNSSRFGKFIEIHFNEFGSIIGAKILTYLLEKSRIVRQVYNERNYHIFYQLLSGATEELKEKLGLLDISEYNYLNKSGCFEIDGVSDSDHFNKTCHAMQVAGITISEQENIFKILSVILLLGNLEFEHKSGANDDSCELLNREPLEKASSLLGMTSSDDLLNTFLTRKVVTGKESYITHNTKERAENARDSLSMFLYGMMFDWLVVKINSSMSIQQKSKSFIGVLDIYGFESFEVNGFEQFCINYANEKLQQLFNQHVFKEEQQEYIKEKIDWSYIDFNDNQDTLDLIEKKPICILTLLDEETMFPKATPQTLATKLYSKLTSHGKFEKPRFSSTAFTINHYAGKVTYETDQFLDKNKDFIIPEQILLLQKSTFSFIKTIMSSSDKFSSGPSAAASSSQPSNKPSGQSGSSSMKFLSVGSQFSTSLSTLMKTISTTTPHYIRCIKPNPEKLPQTFNKMDVIHQLRCGGVMESVRICCAGFPTRRLLSEFYQRYKILYVKDQQQGGAGKKNQKIKDPKQLVQNLFEGIGLSDDKYKLGITKVFLRAGQLAALEDMRLEQLNHSATMIQKTWKRYYYFKRYKALRDSSIIIQTKFRSQMAKQQLTQLRKTHSATTIQRVFRGYKERAQYQKQREAAITLQTAIRKAIDYSSVHKERCENAAIILQTKIRQTLSKREVEKKLKGIIAIQAKWRGKMARKVYIELRAEARSLKTVQAEKNKLQEKLEELQWRLTSESKRKQQLEESKSKSEARIEELVNQNDHLQLALSEYESKFNTLEESNKLVVAELSECKRQYEDITVLHDQSTKSNKRLEKELSDALERIADIEKQLESSEKDKSEFKLKFEDLQVKYGNNMKSLEAFQNELESVKQEREQDNQSNLLEIQNLKKTNQNLEDDYFTLTGLKDTLQRNVEELSLELHNEKEKLAKLSSESTQNESNLLVENKSLETSLAQEKDNCKSLSSKLETTTATLNERINEFQLKEEQYKNSITKLEQSIEEIKSKSTLQIEQSNEKIKKLKSKVEHIEEEKRLINAEFERLRMSKQMLDDEKLQLQNQLQNIKAESNQQQSTSSHQKEKIQNLKSTIEEFTKNNNKLSSDIRSKEDEIRKITLELTDCKSQLSKISKELMDLGSSYQIEKQKAEITIHSLEKSSETLKLELDRIQQSLKQSERDNQQLKDTNYRLENEVKQLSSLKERFESEFFAAKEQNTTSAQESVYLKEVTGQMQQTQARIERELEEKKQAITRLEDDKDSLKKQLTQITTNFEQSSTQLLLAQTELDRLKKKESKHKERTNENSKHIEQLSQEIQSLKMINNDNLKSIQEYENEKKKLKDKLQNSKQDSVTNRESLIKIETELSMLKNHSQWVENSFNEMKSRNQELVENNAIYKNQLQQLHNQIDNAAKEKDQEIQSIKDQLEISRNEMKNHQSEMESIKSTNEIEINQLKQRIEELEFDNKELEDKSVELANQLMSARFETDKVKSEIKEQENKSKRMSVEIQQHIEEGKQQEITSLQQTIEQLKQQYANSSDSWLREKEKLQLELEEARREKELVVRRSSSTQSKQQILADQLDTFRDLIDVIDIKESEWEQLARLVGCKELDTKMISDYLLSCKLEHTILAAQMWFHQIDYWRPFDRERSRDIFRGIIRSTIDFTIKCFDDMDLLSYLLACCSLTLYLYKEDLVKVLGNKSFMPTIPNISDLEELNLQITSSNNNNNTSKPLDFIDQLQQATGRTFGLLFKVMTNKLTPFIESAILNENYNKKLTTVTSLFGQVQANQTQSLQQIDTITNILSSIITIFQHRMVHFTLSQRFFSQIFSWIGSTILKAFMLRQGFCSESFALFVRSKIDALVRWSGEVGNVWCGDITKSFTQVREVIAVLVYKEKDKFADEKIRKTVCPTLNANQLKQLLAMYNPGDFGGKRVSTKVITAICPPNKAYVNLPLFDSEKLIPIPIESLHYLETSDIKGLSLPSSIRTSIENEIKNIKSTIVSKNLSSNNI